MAGQYCYERWLPAAELPPTAFDHAAIIGCALEAAARETKHCKEIFTARAPKPGGHGTKH